MVYVYALISIVLGALAQLLLKLGVISSSPDGAFTLHSICRLLCNLQFILGIIFYGMSLLIWLYILAHLELSKAYPLVSLGYIITMFLGFFFLNEPLSFLKIIGVSLIVIGVFCISRS